MLLGRTLRNNNNNINSNNNNNNNINNNREQILDEEEEVDEIVEVLDFAGATSSAADTNNGNSTNGNRTTKRNEMVKIDAVIERLLLKRDQDSYVMDSAKHIAVILLFWLVILSSRSNLAFIYDFSEGVNNVLINRDIPGYHVPKTYMDLQNLQDVYRYLISVYAPSVTGTNNISGVPPDIAKQLPALTSLGGLESCRVIGKVRMRQVRVDPVPCRANTSFNCYPAYSSAAMSTADYAPAGSGYFFKWSENSLGTEFYSPFSGLYYDASGYNLDFDVNLNQMLTTFVSLQKIGWVDEGTRAIFINTNYYNANIRGWFCSQLCVEFTQSGAIFVGDLIMKPLDVAVFEWSGPLGFIQVILLPILLVVVMVYNYVMFFREVYIQASVEGGAIRYLTRLWTVTEFSHLLLMTIYMCYWVVYGFSSTRKEILRATTTFDDSKYLYLESLSYTYYGQMTQLVAFTFFFGTVSLFRYLEANRRLAVVWASLRHAFDDLVAFLVLLLMLILGFSFVGYLLYGPYLNQFRRFPVTIITTIRQAMGDIDYESMDQIYSVATPFYFLMFVLMMIFVMINLFISLISDAYSAVNNELREESSIITKFSKGMRKKFQRFASATKRKFQNLVKSVKKPNEEQDQQRKVKKSHISTRTIIMKLKNLRQFSEDIATDEILKLIEEAEKAKEMKQMKNRASITNLDPSIAVADHKQQKLLRAVSALKDGFKKYRKHQNCEETHEEHSHHHADGEDHDHDHDHHDHEDHEHNEDHGHEDGECCEEDSSCDEEGPNGLNLSRFNLKTKQGIEECIQYLNRKLEGMRKDEDVNDASTVATTTTMTTVLPTKPQLRAVDDEEEDHDSFKTKMSSLSGLCLKSDVDDGDIIEEEEDQNVSLPMNYLRLSSKCDDVVAPSPPLLPATSRTPPAQFVLPSVQSDRLTVRRESIELDQEENNNSDHHEADNNDKYSTLLFRSST